MPERTDPEQLRLASLSARDADAASALHARCFERAWSPAEFRTFAGASVYSGLLAWQGERLAGLLIVMTIGSESEILTLAVDPELRRQGIGAAILKRFLAEAAGIGVNAVFLEVGYRNDAARALYEACGFEVVGERPGYYQTPDGAEDAVIMKAALPVTIAAAASD